MISFIPLRTGDLSAFFENPVFLSAITSLIFAQLLKAIIVLLKNTKKSAKEIVATLLWKTGGMPSSHSSLVTALATSVAFKEGIGSTLFIVTLCLALIVIRDSMGVRRSAGLQARALNLLGKQVGDRLNIEYHQVKEIQGHAPLEVLVGSLLGILIAAAFALL
ncbi:divergent PAP2 family protein [Gracilinema caldarium]|uniref:Acid phosphatase/vanadium-dependent haloperoxidase related protein n=1 Tax=Gracilinema caldarium (strain ATCC 51460 / DSM 7334 / H1) TaxID=744872 RepID=F8F1T7_GRAC1|nr:divergent PAP2 family protein [Gracilinema caldarium]AEJ19421.1 acid phosphatase/vanadium-dependent haloperoxidase related protein [Gracilinema caldarium DSM 7334]